MISVIFPGQGSQSVGMAKEIYEKYSSLNPNFLLGISEQNDVPRFLHSVILTISGLLKATNTTKPVVIVRLRKNPK